MPTNTIRLHRVLRASPERVYRAFIDPDAMSKWLPPNGFTGRVHHLDARVGGSFRMSFTNFTTGGAPTNALRKRYPAWSVSKECHQEVIMKSIVLSLMIVSLICSMSWTGCAPKDDDAIQGTWLPATAELGGKTIPDEVRKAVTLVIEGDTYTVTVGNVVDRGTLKENPAARPRELDVTGTEGPNKGRTIPAIYERTGDTLRICYDLSGRSRPAEFRTEEGTRLFLVTYLRAKT
jgi:uncharacterized protein (TIGR03067 family)